MALLTIEREKEMLFLLKVEVKQMPQMPVKDFLGYVIKEWEYFSRYQRRGKIVAGGSTFHFTLPLRVDFVLNA